jgi:alanyl-tRNA synthetase
MLNGTGRPIRDSQGWKERNMPTANEIRQQFIDFFVTRHGHTAVPSSSVVPLDDPTLLFTNAGMNQFKDVFLDTGTRPYKRAVDSQKCIRAGGKHNDLEDVGRDTYHHTFFEMLGNWSFGDYFKKEAIAWAWELLTKVWKLDKARLHATVFEGDPQAGLSRDDEAAEFWRTETDIDPSHIHLGSTKDNFWMMGDTGPCGPCSEIHYDRTPDKSGARLVNVGDARVIEIWNLVFIQFNRDESGKLHLLPAKHVDTGMGFERITAVLQGKESNYDTDVFNPLMEAIGKLVGKHYGGQLGSIDDVAFRVVADHLRMLTFAITDGALPGNKGRGAVVRSVLRRAFRFGYQYLGQREPFIYRLVPALVAQMGGAYPDLKTNPQRVQDIIRGEEGDFLKTVDRGLALFEKAVHDARRQFQVAKIRPYPAGPALVEPYTKDEIEYAEKYPKEKYPVPVISDIVAFNLYTTYGFPFDLIKQMAEEQGYRVDEEGYSRLMKEHEEKSRSATGVSDADMAAILQGIAERRRRITESIAEEEAAQNEEAVQIIQTIEQRRREAAAVHSGRSPEATDDRSKWERAQAEGKIQGWIVEGHWHNSGNLYPGVRAGLMVDRTCFYAESGGQVGDKGHIATATGRFEVTQTQKVADTIVHLGDVVSGHIEPGQAAKLEVSPDREFTRKNHTATHLLHWALHRVLGEHVEQRGSKVKPDEFTFDFSHSGPMTDAEKAQIEQLVNQNVYTDLPVAWRELPIAEAKRLPGVRAFFGDKYGDVVRVVEIGDGFSREFCGGTHIEHTGQIGFFKILSEEAVGKGVRRLTCVTARRAVEVVQQEDAILAEVAGSFHCRPDELPARVAGLQEEVKKLQQQLRKGAATDLQGVADKLLASADEVGGAKVIVGEMPAGPDEQMRQQLDRLRQKAGTAVVVIGWSEDGKVQLLAAVTDDLVKKGVHAGKLVGEVAQVVGGKGGGRPNMAQAGGKEPAKLAEALQLARQLARAYLGK